MKFIEDCIKVSAEAVLIIGCVVIGALLLPQLSAGDEVVVPFLLQVEEWHCECIAT